ncbi:MAG: hypothetical protein IH897_03185, partial [Planctomycetes bacterium]|nr:hypothetical protein [Planctomycetota bacterium]
MGGAFDANGGTGCQGRDCPQIAACCFDGRCAELTSVECGIAGGVFATNGELCTVELCATGACCHDDGTCEGPPDIEIVHIEDCGSGDFYAGRTCDICPLPGGCCLPAGCENRTRGSCEAAGGQFAGEGEENLCPPDGQANCTLAACCQDDGTCRDTIAAICDPADHDPGGFVCVEVGDACPAAEACCLPDGNGSCDDLTLEACATPVPDGFGGTSQGPGTVCDADTCTEGACCFDGEPCRDNLTIGECSALNGTHQGVATVCTEDTCTEGACCRPGAFGEPRICEVDQTRDECDALAGTHQGVGTICTEDFCTEGACCVPEEPGSTVTNCVDGLTIDECADEGGQHGGRDTICLDGGLCTEGACCRDGGSCNNNRTENACADFGETHLGRGTLCSGSQCLQGACCVNDGTCRDDVVFANCLPADGIFEFTETCDNLTCPPAGACCDDNDNCSQLTQAACDDQLGTHFGVGLLCDGGSCPGACCFDGGNCLVATEDDCDNGSGDFGLSKTCETIVCGGSCCHADGTCQFVSEVDCAAGDVFSPDQTCEQAGCEPRGACCTSGGCSGPVTESACTSGGGL